MRLRAALVTAAALLLAACGAVRPVNPPLAHADPLVGYRYLTPERIKHPPEDIVVLAFSGGGTRAAAFSYGVLEALRKVEVISAAGEKNRLLDSVSIVSGVSGGSFTALAYGLYGEKLFDEYEARFLKRDVEGVLLGRLFNPLNWGPLTSTGWGRSELAADYYDEILFEGATYADLAKRPGPMVLANATDLSTGAQFYFSQTMFDVICSDLAAVRLSRAAASSSAVPVALSPVTFNNYGGSCGFRPPPWLKQVADSRLPLRPSTRSERALREMQIFADGKARPYLHLVDGGVADNLAIRGILSILDEVEALRMLALPTPLDNVRRIVIFVVNSLSIPKTEWDQHVDAPGPLEVLLQATGVPIDHYSYEAVELLRDTGYRWKMLRGMRDAAGPSDLAKPEFIEAARAPNAELFIIEVSFDELADTTERAYLNQLPTTLALSGEAVDRLRLAAATIVRQSPDFARYLDELRRRGYRVISPAATGSAE